jgi:glyoxylase-like metal-dependent hydrolase (beta-lactamase superfamily II)/rhodanese-related sulfurtransferase
VYLAAEGFPLTETSRGEVWTATDLLERLQRRDRFFVVDVRNRDEFEKLRLEGRAPLPALNAPYFEMLELGGKEEMLDSVIAYIERDLAGQLPSGMPILAVCAKGDTSEIVAQGLRRLGYPTANLQGGMRAWGEHYATRSLAEAEDLAVFQVSRPARGCLSYLVASAGEAIVIDPLRHVQPYLDLARWAGVAIKTVLDTHGHADHISGGPALAARTGASYHLHPYDAIHPLDVLPATIPYEALREGEKLRVGRHELEALHIPGHTLGLVALRLQDRFLFTGDSIFIRSLARPDLGGRAEAWAPLHARSLRRLLELPPLITVLPGHFSSLDEADETGRFAAALDELKRHNEGLALLLHASDEGFVRYLLESLPRPVAEYLEIKRVNAGLSKPGEEDAAALETGKNLCALSQAYAASGSQGS